MTDEEYEEQEREIRWMLSWVDERDIEKKRGKGNDNRRRVRQVGK